MNKGFQFTIAVALGYDGPVIEEFFLELELVKTAIIGLGYMGEIRQRVVEAHPELELTMLCDANSSTFDSFNKYSYSTVTDPMDVLNSDCELVFICTPNNLIPELAIEAMKRGKHVFAEKPPGRCLQDIEQIRAQEQLSPECKLMFGFNHRYHPGILRAKTIAQSDRFGKILWARGIYGKSGGESFRESWRNNKSVSGGGILLDQGIHMLDLFNYFCDDFSQVKSFLSNDYWQFDLEDNAFVLLKNDRGQNAMLHSSATLWKHSFKLELGLERGYLVIEGLLSKTGSYGRETLTVGKQQFEAEAFAKGNPVEEKTYFDTDLSWEIEVDNIARCIVDDVPVEKSSSRDALAVMEIIDRAYKDNGPLPPVN